MLSRLQQVFDALKGAKLTLKLSKCYFGYPEVAYLGFMLLVEGVRPGEQKIMAFKEFPKPNNTHEVRRFLGLCGFFRRFIPRYAQPMSDLLKDSVPFVWTTSQERRYV
ncbi:uncharacterized protein LOC107884428 [Acyrthosiphon pisum]|uniref:Uncharacterized protein n=1 Tax=Acyrthosiphon pisum TaxID=7029 RepID=A0A8R2H8A8_ACYPI|nr:uncharacterized protein LOC107884428 [Acyrthosiphon pisum]|eukprot:XP_016661947.1 PREDICTED: uncharacterized mitochondrial protein AtMg00860-like [Acyrthosiphon pisum]